MEQEAEVEEEEDVLPQMEVSGGKQGLVDERLRALLMLLNQVGAQNSSDSNCYHLNKYILIHLTAYWALK